MRYKGGCHCGRIAFEVEVEGDIGKVIECNCSICRRKGSLLWFVPRARLELLTPEQDASEYLFNRHVIHHRFCPTCGMHPYAVGKDRQGNAMAAINVRCLDGIDPAGLDVQPFDGAAL